jgi:hypothetical protein
VVSFLGHSGNDVNRSSRKPRLEPFLKILFLTEGVSDLPALLRVGHHREPNPLSVTGRRRTASGFQYSQKK